MSSVTGATRFQNRVQSRKYKFFTRIRLRNSDGVETKFSITAKRFYCGRSYAEPGDCECGNCDGICGPTTGCPCQSCRELAEIRYCGNTFCVRGKCFCGTCDGRCGPTNGCPCVDCVLRSNLLPAIYRFDQSRTMLFPAEDLFTTLLLASSTTSFSKCPSGHATFALKGLPPRYEASAAAEGRVGIAQCDECDKFIFGCLAHCALCSYDLCRDCEISKFGVHIKARVMCSNTHVMTTLFEKPVGYMGNIKCICCQEAIACDNGFFHCPTCKFDLCKDCEGERYASLRVVWPQTLKCPCGRHPGEVTFIRNVSSLCCSQCEDDISISEGYMFAECCTGSAICYNCCRQILRKSLAKPKLACPQQHVMKGFCSSKQGLNVCDVCGERIVYKDGYLRCDLCDYDLCHSCARVLAEERASAETTHHQPDQRQLTSGGVGCVAGDAQAGGKQSGECGQQHEAAAAAHHADPHTAVLSSYDATTTLAKPAQLLREYDSYREDIISSKDVVGCVQQQQQQSVVGDSPRTATCPTTATAPTTLALSPSMMPTNEAHRCGGSRIPPSPLRPVAAADADDRDKDDDDGVQTVLRQGLSCPLTPSSTSRNAQQPECAVDDSASSLSPDLQSSPKQEGINDDDDDDDDSSFPSSVPLTLRVVYESEEWVIPAHDVSSLDSLLDIVAKLISVFENSSTQTEHQDGQHPTEVGAEKVSIGSDCILLDVMEGGECSPLHLPRRFSEAFRRLTEENPVLRILASLHNCPIRNWRLQEEIGSGSFGKVYKAIDDNHFVFAAKEIPLRKVIENMPQSSRECETSDGTAEALLSLQSEIRLVRQLKHKNLIMYFGSYDGVRDYFYILMEHLPGGSLSSLIHKSRLNLAQVQNYARQLLSGLSFLHSFSVVHRDIKPDNLMLSASGELKIVDFGTAKHLSATLSGSTGQRGTAAYMAPEIMKSEPCRTSCDIWSVGCTIVQMLTRKLPYSEAGKLEPLQLMLRIYLDKKGPLWPKEASCEELDNLLEQCFRADPLERPTAAQLLAHPFFSRNFEQ